MNLCKKAYSDSESSDHIPDEYKTNKELLNCFVQGFFEKSGSITLGTILNHNVESKIVSSNIKVVNDIKNMYRSIAEPSYFDYKSGFLCYTNNNTVNFLHEIYSKSDARFRNKSMYNKYIEILKYDHPKHHIPFCRFIKLRNDAVSPSKIKASDLGYNLTILEKIKDIDTKTGIYDTFIKVEPCFGFYTKIVCTKELIERGFRLEKYVDNSNNSLKVVLTKIDDTFPDLKLPISNCCVLILEKGIYYEMEEVFDFILL